MPNEVVTAVIAAQNTFSDWMRIKGYFNFSLWGTWAGTVTLQRSFDGGSTQLDFDTYIANEEDILFEPEGAFYRFGIQTGDYTSGTAQGRLGQHVMY
jgi:hypothetical protein